MSYSGGHRRTLRRAGGCRDARALALASISQVCVQSQNGRTSESLRCLSADLAAYISAHGIVPVPSTLRQLELRCGAKGVGTDILFEVAEVTKPLPGPAQLWEMWEGPLQDLVARGTRDSAKGSVFGLSVYLSSPRTVAVLTRQESPYDVAIRSTDDNGVYVEGKYHEMVDGVALVATHGALGFHVCERDRSRALPSFAFQCPPSEGDGTVAELFSKSGVAGCRISMLGLLCPIRRICRNPKPLYRCSSAGGERHAFGGVLCG